MATFPKIGYLKTNNELSYRLQQFTTPPALLHDAPIIMYRRRLHGARHRGAGVRRFRAVARLGWVEECTRLFDDTMGMFRTTFAWHDSVRRLDSRGSCCRSSGYGFSLSYDGMDLVHRVGAVRC